MASLRSLILDERTAVVCGPDDKNSPEKFSNQFQIIYRDQDSLKSRDTILVNAQNVYQSVLELPEEEVMRQGPEAGDFWLIPCLKPPYRTMWLEIIRRWNGRRMGVMLYRGGNEFMKKAIRHAEINGYETYDSEGAQKAQNDPHTTYVVANCWEESKDGYALFTGGFHYFLNQAGDLQESFFFLPSVHVPPKIEKELDHLLWQTQFWTLHALARMNCHNVKLVPQKAGAPKIKKGKPRAPFSSPWHEIVVTSLPELRREQKGVIAPDGEKRELRFHKVRGHYADYTKGKGLFGKYKVRIWIEEHSAGEPELGTVVSSYTVR